MRLPRRGLLGALLTVVVTATALVAASGTPAAAHTPHDTIDDVAFSPEFARDHTVYTISREYLLRSTDGGTTWSRLSNGLDNKHPMVTVEVSATDPMRLYATSRGDGAYASTDGGASWARVDQGMGTNRTLVHLAVSPHDDRLVFAITNFGDLVRTDDGGKQWAPVTGTAGEHAMSIAFVPDQPGTVLVGVHGKVLRSRDRGGSWTPLATGSDDPVTAIVVSPDHERDRTFFAGTADHGIRKTVDDGATFTDASVGITDERIQGLAVSPTFAEDDVVWATTWKHGVFRTADGGATWVRSSEGTTTNGMADELGTAHFRGITASPVTGKGRPTLFVAGFDGLFRSTDSGSEWKEIQTEDATNIVAFDVSPDYEKDRSIAVATYINGVSRSDDDGSHWTKLNVGITHWYEFTRRPDYFARIMSIDYAPTYARDKTMFLGSKGYWFTSHDRGRPWTISSPEGLVVKDEFPPDYLIPAFSPAFATDHTVVAGTDGGKVFRSTDGGETFEKVAELDDDDVVSTLVATPDFASKGTLLAGTPKGIYQVSDRGATWKAVRGAPSAVLSMSISPGFAEDRTAFAGTVNGLFRTGDGGATWEPVNGTTLGDGAYVEAVVTSPSFATDGTMLVSQRGNGLFRSTDKGKTFQPVGQDLRDRNVLLCNYFLPTSEPIVFSPNFAEDRTVFGSAESTLYRSTDAGDTWEAISIPRATHGMKASDAPNPLLLVPRLERLKDGRALAPDPAAGTRSGTGPDAERSSAAAPSSNVLLLSKKRVAAAVLAGLLTLAGLWLVKFGSRSTKQRLAVYLRLACSALVSGLVLYLVARRH